MFNLVFASVTVIPSFIIGGWLGTTKNQLFKIYAITVGVALVVGFLFVLLLVLVSSSSSSSSVSVLTTDGFTIAEGVTDKILTNQTSGSLPNNSVSTVEAALNLYDVFGVHVATIYYHDAFGWNGHKVVAMKPSWSYWNAAWDVSDFNPGSSSVTNFGPESASNGYCSFALANSFGTVSAEYTGTATMRDNGTASVSITG